MRRILTSFSQFRRAQAGVVMPLVAVSLTALMAATGSAIDMGRAQIVQSRLSNALDAAGLAAGATVSTADLNTQVTNYMNANYPTNYMGSTLKNVLATPNTDNSVISLSAQADVNMTFMKLFGKQKVTVSATSEITRASKGMELVLVMDVTGSMNCPVSGACASTATEQANSKLASAKTAAITLLNIVYGATNNTHEDLWVGLVPFSQTVNIGTTRSSWTVNTTFNWGPNSGTWGGCVEARAANNRDVTDDTPTTQLFPKYYWACDTNNQWYGTNNAHTNCTASGTGFAYNTPINTTTRGPNYWCPTAVTPMVAEKATVVTAINAMTAQGGTEIPLGLSWGWRMLSPKWRGLWGGQMNTNSLPLNYKSPLMNKVIVLMSDGDNDIVTGWYSAYRYPSENQLVTMPCSGASCNSCTSGGNCAVAETALNNRTTQICNSLKAEGVLIYTVAFGASITSTGQGLLQGCASKPEYYFYSPTNASLQNSFKMIGDSLANLRISK